MKLSVLFIFLLSLNLSAYEDIKSSYKAFLNAAYCDVFGVTRSESNADDKKYIDLHINNLLSGRDTIKSILSKFNNIKRDYAKRGEKVRGGKCELHYSNSNRFLQDHIEWLENAYIGELGVKRNLDDKWFLAHLRDLVSGQKKREDIEKHFKDYWSCHQYNPKKYAIYGEPVSSSSKKQRSSESGIDSSYQCSYESTNNNTDTGVTTTSQAGLIDIPYARYDEARVAYYKKVRPGTWKKDCNNAGESDPNKIFVEIDMIAKFDNSFAEKAINCQRQVMNDPEYSCFREALQYRADIHLCYEKAREGKSSSERTMIKENCNADALKNANARLQQKKCKRRINRYIEDKYFTSKGPEVYKYASRGWGLGTRSASVEFGQYYREDWRQIDKKYLSCVKDAQFEISHQLFLEKRAFDKKVLMACGSDGSYERSFYKRGQQDETVIRFSLPDHVFNLAAINKIVPERAKKAAIEVGSYTGYTNIYKRNALDISGKKYWDFTLEYLLNRKGEIVSFRTRTHMVSGNKVLVLNDQGEITFDQDGKLALKDYQSADDKIYTSCDTKFYELKLKEFQDEFRQHIRAWDHQLHRQDCYDNPNSPECIELATNSTRILEQKKQELQGKFMDYAMENAVCAQDISQLANLKIKYDLDRLTAKSSTHYEQDCSKVGGIIVKDEYGKTFCRLQGNQCPKSWSQHENWSTAKDVNISCNVKAQEIKLDCNGKSYSYNVPAVSKGHTIKGHSWSNTQRASETSINADKLYYSASQSAYFACRKEADKTHKYISGPSASMENICGIQVPKRITYKYERDSGFDGKTTDYVFFTKKAHGKRASSKLTEIGCK